MGVSNQPVTLTPGQVAELNRKLADFRHDLNNHLTLILSAAELIKRKPEAAVGLADRIMGLPRIIMEETQCFSLEFERAFGITRE